MLALSPFSWLHAGRRERQITYRSLPELVWRIICKYACTDGGRTACSLALVSKTVRAVSNPYRFHSVSLVEGSAAKPTILKQSLAKARQVALQDGTDIPRLRHLCLDLLFFTGFTSHPPDNQSLSSILSGVYRSIAPVLELSLEVSPHLESLCLFRTNWERPDLNIAGLFVLYILLECNDFPKLQELSIGGGYQGIFVNRDRPHEPLFPVLSRLHIMAAAIHPIDFDSLFRDAPHLLELRLQVTMSPLDQGVPGWMVSLAQSLSAF